jgi:hypothetical protein
VKKRTAVCPRPADPRRHQPRPPVAPGGPLLTRLNAARCSSRAQARLSDGAAGTVHHGKAAAGRAICAGVPKQVRPRRLASAAPRCLVEGLVVPRASDGTNARLMLVRRTDRVALLVRWG